MSAPDPRSVPAAHSMDTAWFGVDADGNVALFVTGEAGAMPTDAVGAGDYGRELGGHPDGFEAIRAVLGVAEDIWDEEAAGRVYRFTHDDDNWVAGRYVQAYAPERPARIEEVPAELREGIVKLPVRFVTKPAIQPVEHVPCDAWGAVWLSSDGNVARPFPGREAEAEEEWPDVDDPSVTFERDPGVAVAGASSAAPSASPAPRAPVPRAPAPRAPTLPTPRPALRAGCSWAARGSRGPRALGSGCTRRASATTASGICRCAAATPPRRARWRWSPAGASSR